MSAYRDTEASTPAPETSVAIGRQALGVVLGVVAAALPIALALGAQGSVPDHANTGGLTGWLLHVGGMIVLGLLVGSVSALLWWAARRVFPSPSLWIVAMYGVLYSPVAGWKLFDALNVHLDRSPPATHTVRFVRFSEPRKGPREVTVTSWHGDGTEEFEDYVLERDRQPGRPFRLVVHRGALGREYVTDLTAL